MRLSFSFSFREPDSAFFPSNSKKSFPQELNDLWVNARNLPPVIRQIVRHVFLCSRAARGTYDIAVPSPILVRVSSHIMNSTPHLSFQRMVSMVSDSLFHNALRQRPVQTFTTFVCLRRKYGRHRRGRHSAGFPSAIIAIPARTCYQLLGPPCCTNWDFLIKPYAHQPSKALVAT